MGIVLARAEKAVVRELQVGETRMAHAAIAELRPAFAHDPEAFVSQVDDVQRPQGYRLYAVFDPDDTDAAAVAGFRRGTYLAWGDVLYIDDLSTRAVFRKRGYGRALLEAVEVEGRRLGCDAIHLDSGHRRFDAHRLYLSVGYEIRSHHFVRPLAEKGPVPAVGDS